MKLAQRILGPLCALLLVPFSHPAEPVVEAPRKRPVAVLLGPVAPGSNDAAKPGEPLVARAALLQPPIANLDPPQCPERSGFVAGASIYFLRPYVQNNTALVTTINPGQPNSQVVSDPFHWDFNPTFAGWIGWTSEGGLGVRSRYFQFDQNSNTTTASNGATPPPQTQTTINPPLGNLLPLSTGGTAFGSPSTTLNTGFGTDQIVVGSDLRIHAIDLEATYAWRSARCSWLAFGGGRYLDMQQDYRATLINTGGGAAISELQTLNSTRRFSGGGPTLGLQGNVQIGRSALSLFASGRGSFLVGSNRENVAFSQSVNDPTGLIPGHVPPPSVLQINPTASRMSDHTLPISEFELGLEYGRNVGRTWVFFRAAAVNQTYFDAGSASLAIGNLSLFGIQTSLGVNY